MTITLSVVAGDETLVVIKRVNVSTATEKNLNPTETAFHLTSVKDEQEAPVTATPPGDGTCLTEEHGGVLSVGVGKHFLTALNVPPEPVEYPVLSIGSTVDAADVLVAKETYYYSVFSTAGDFNEKIFKSGGTRRVKWTLKEEDVGEVQLWVVTRDGRGGATWCAQTVEVTPAP